VQILYSRIWSIFFQISKSSSGSSSSKSSASS